LCAETREHLARGAVAFLEQAEQEMLRSDVTVTARLGLAKRQLEHILRAVGEGNVSRGSSRAFADEVANSLARAIEGDVE
jgi:hypothetical protein